MDSLDRSASISPLEITREFERYLSNVGALSQEKCVSIPVAEAICNM